MNELDLSSEQLPDNVEDWPTFLEPYLKPLVTEDLHHLLQYKVGPPDSEDSRSYVIMPSSTPAMSDDGDNDDAKTIISSSPPQRWCIRMFPFDFELREENPVGTYEWTEETLRQYLQDLAEDVSRTLPSLDRKDPNMMHLYHQMVVIATKVLHKLYRENIPSHILQQ